MLAKIVLHIAEDGPPKSASLNDTDGFRKAIFQISENTESTIFERGPQVGEEQSCYRQQREKNIEKQRSEIRSSPNWGSSTRRPLRSRGSRRRPRRATWRWAARCRLGSKRHPNAGEKLPFEKIEWSAEVDNVLSR